MQYFIPWTARNSSRGSVALTAALQLVGVFLILTCMTRTVRACGASAGSAGVAVCSLEDIREKERFKWRVGSTYGYSNTVIVFTGDGIDGKRNVDQERHVTLALGEWRPKRRLGLYVGAGALLGGTMHDADFRAVFEPGPVFAIGMNWIALQSKGAIPFVLLSAQFSGLSSSTRVTDEGGVPTGRTPRYSAFDLRLGGAAGYTLWKGLSPYVLARVFGGPVSYALDGEATGTDLYHYQVGAGLSILVDGRLDFFVEGSAAGERGLNGGLGFAF